MKKCEKCGRTDDLVEMPNPEAMGASEKAYLCRNCLKYDCKACPDDCCVAPVLGTSEHGLLSPSSMAKGRSGVMRHIEYPYVLVCSGSEIGDGTIIGSHSFIGRDVVIGARCKIQSHFFVGHKGAVIEDDVFIGPNVTLCNVSRPRAFTKAERLTPVTIKRGATIGASVTILPGVTIGGYAMVGAGSVVTKDVAHHTEVFGNPAKVRGSVNEDGSPSMNY